MARRWSMNSVLTPADRIRSSFQTPMVMDCSVRAVGERQGGRSWSVQARGRRFPTWLPPLISTLDLRTRSALISGARTVERATSTATPTWTTGLVLIPGVRMRRRATMMRPLQRMTGPVPMRRRGMKTATVTMPVIRIRRRPLARNLRDM